VCLSRANTQREKEREREKSFEEIDARVPQEHARTHAERMFVNNDANQRLCESLVSSSYVRQADEATKRQSKLFSQLLSNRKLPTDGWNEHTIESFLLELAQLDSNNFLDNCGVGEREGRVYSKLVKRRNFGLHHGIGRSGDVSADQPKAIGSSIIAKLANILVTDAIDIRFTKHRLHYDVTLAFVYGDVAVFGVQRFGSAPTKRRTRRTTKQDSLDAFRPEDVHKKHTSEWLRRLRC